MAIMSNTDTKKVKVTPGNLQSIPDILPQNKRIEEEVTMELNPSEIKRCMSFGTVKEVKSTGEVNLDPMNFNQKDDAASDTDSVRVTSGSGKNESSSSSNTDTSQVENTVDSASGDDASEEDAE